MANRTKSDAIRDPARLAALESSGLLDSAPEPEFDLITRLACTALRAQASLISLVAADRQFAKSRFGLRPVSASLAELPLLRRLCEEVVRAGAAVLVDDVRNDPRLASAPAPGGPDPRAFAGVPLHDPAGHRLGALCVIRRRTRSWSAEDRRLLEDIAELAVTELRLRASLTSALASELARDQSDRRTLAGVGSWEWDPDTGRLSCSPGLCRLLELDRAPTTLAEYEVLVPADKRAELLAGALARLTPDGSWEAEHRIAMSDGSWHLVRSRGMTRVGADGLTHLVHGRVEDITAEAEREAGFRAAFWDTPIGAALLGLVGADRGCWLSTNQELERMLGATPGGLVGRPLDQDTHTEDHERLDLVLDRLARGEAERTRHEQRLRRADGSWLMVVATHSVVRGPSGEPSYAVSHYLDVTERERHDHALGLLADQDALTGVLNRRRFAEELARTLARSARSGSSGALLILDLDGLRRVNERAGNAAGDGVLIHVAHSVAAMLRAGDSFARTGDDQFAILLADADLAQSRRVANRLLRAVRRRLDGGADAATPMITASIGVTAWGDRPPSDASHAFVEAETALYEAKSAGGDQYAVYSAEQDELGLDAEL